MTSDRVQKLLEIVGPQDRADLTVLNDGVAGSMLAYKRTNTAAALKDWQAGKAELAETVARLWARYFPDDPAEVSIFETQKDARMWLVKQGFKVSAGKFSTDCRSGACVVQKDKTIRLQDLKAYASALAVDVSSVEGDSGLVRRKASLEVRRLEQQIEKAEIENRKDDRRWILREAATELAAALIVQLRISLRHHLGLKTAAIILAAAGDSSRAVEVEAALQATISGAFNELADTREALIIGLVDADRDFEDEDE